MVNSKEEVNILELYGKECLLTKEDFIKQYKINKNGLTNQEAESNLKQFGENIISKSRPKRWYNYFLESLFTPFNIVLLGIIVLLCYTDINSFRRE